VLFVALRKANEKLPILSISDLSRFCRLASEPEYELAQQIAADAVSNREIIESRIGELPLLLSDEGTTQLEGWSI
jgi:hypothetical protein